ncbi:diguanylate cyclase [Novipirellula herctigrandis]|uniref:sensor domain-containing diguanylate cyclase n=1 Tax=Novipirellula herctigrandis TaxID=2527986 RepID=UPI003AF361D6
MNTLDRFHGFTNFDAASKKALRYLHENYGFALWMVTRTEGDDWIVLQVEDHGYEVKSGDVFRWADSFCSQMVLGNGPCIAPDSQVIPAYANALIGTQVSIAAYVGLPLTRPDGSLFGTLCAIDPSVQPDNIVNALPQFELIAQLLTTILELEIHSENEVRRAERAEAIAESDPLTGLFNRRGWDRLLKAEESRCRRLGHPASIISIDLDELKQINDCYGHGKGDELLVKAAELIRSNSREYDTAARLGGDEFSILVIHDQDQEALSLSDRLRESFTLEGLNASIGVGRRKPNGSLQEAWQCSDASMYEQKRSRKKQSQQIS